MQRSTKPWTLLVVIIVLAFLAWIFFGHHGSSVAPVSAPIDQTSQTNGTAPATVSNATSDNSDAAINQDMTNIDTQMNGLNSDNTSADQSLNSSGQ